ARLECADALGSARTRLVGHRLYEPGARLRDRRGTSLRHVRAWAVRAAVEDAAPSEQRVRGEASVRLIGRATRVGALPARRETRERPGVVRRYRGDAAHALDRASLHRSHSLPQTR